MLHVTNGSVFLSRLHDLGVPGRIVPWDDVLHEGPVPGGLTPEQLRRVRAEFLAVDRADVDDIERSLAARDETLATAVEGDEIVLWYEHDLYDQLHVLQVLAAIGRARERLGRAGARVTAILADDYLAAQPDARLTEWFNAREQVTDDQWAAAAEGWRAFRAADPLALAAYDHPGAWPTLRAALRRHLQQFPDVRTGLSRTEAQTLAAVDDGPLTVGAAFRASNHAVEDAIFMGDWGWWSHIRPLLSAEHPLLDVVGERPSCFDHADWWNDDETAPRLALTTAGARVLAGEADHIALNGIDRWLGGVHLVQGSAGRPPAEASSEGGPIWRWDDTRGTVLPPSLS